MKWEEYCHTEFLEPERVEDTLVKKLQGSVHVTQFENIHVLRVWFSIDDCHSWTNFILMYPVIGDLIMKLPDELHHLPPFQFPSDTGFLENPKPYYLQVNITLLLQLIIASGGTDVRAKLTGLYDVHCIIPSLYWTRYTESLHCAVCPEVLM